MIPDSLWQQHQPPTVCQHSGIHMARTLFVTASDSKTSSHMQHALCSSKAACLIFLPAFQWAFRVAGLALLHPARAMSQLVRNFEGSLQVYLRSQALRLVSSSSARTLYSKWSDCGSLIGLAIWFCPLCVMPEANLSCNLESMLFHRRLCLE